MALDKILVVVFVSLFFMVNCSGGEEGDSIQNVEDGKDLARMEQIFRKSLRTKKTVNCKKPQFQLNPMCMHAKFSRRFFEVEKSVKKLRSSQNMENKLNVLEKSLKTEKTKMNSWISNLNEFQRSSKNENAEMLYILDNFNSSITKMIEEGEVLKMENSKMNQTIQESSDHIKNITQQLNLFNDRTLKAEQTNTQLTESLAAQQLVLEEHKQAFTKLEKLLNITIH
jgi:hypothetical protein